MNNFLFVLFQWLKRDFLSKYRGSWLGLFWPIIQPLAQVAVFTLIFYDFMSMRWPVERGAELLPVSQSKFMYSLNMLAGLSVFNYFAEILGRAPVCIFSQPNLVTKVKFPVIIIPMVTVGTALVHILVGCIAIWFASVILGVATLQALWLFLWIIPLVVYGFAIAVVLASLGVYVRDLVQIMPAFTSLLMFLTPIFYPMTVVNESLQWIFLLNPLTWAVESFREIVLLGLPLNIIDWIFQICVASVMAVISYLAFRRLRLGFGDVL